MVPVYCGFTLELIVEGVEEDGQKLLCVLLYQWFEVRSPMDKFRLQN